MKHAKPGTVSHGTLRECDLLEAFTNELDRLRDNNLYTSDGDELALVDLNGRVDDLLGMLERKHDLRGSWADVVDHDGDEAGWWLEELTDLLNSYAPPGHHFGAHEGDGSDFGFWPSEECACDAPDAPSCDAHGPFPR
jgi:hypothetical protein